MAFSCKIVLAHHEKIDGKKRVYLQAIINRRRATVSLDFYVDDLMFDERRQCMKAADPNAKDYDAEFYNAIAKANTIASRYRLEEKVLTVDNFKTEFVRPPDKMDLIKFMLNELELKRPSLAINTYKQHCTVINKLKSFQKRIDFSEISVEFMQRFQNHLLKKKVGDVVLAMKGSTVNKLMKIVKQYLSDARAKGHKFKDPIIKVKTFKSNRLGLSQHEVNLMDQYFMKSDCPTSHRKLLRYFLFSCYTGVRISDIKVITWNNIHDDLLIFTPQKTKYNQNTVTIPLMEMDKKYLPPFKKSGPIFETFADAVSNRYIKSIAAHLGIRKNVTYHTSRHTFGSLFAEGGNIVALQKMMGHGDIKTTMGYIHTSTKNLVDAKNERFGKRPEIPAKE